MPAVRMKRSPLIRRAKDGTWGRCCDSAFYVWAGPISAEKVAEAGRMRFEGKEYVVRDGGVMHFRAAN